MTCVDCDKFNICKDENSLTDYYGKYLISDNVEELCEDFCRIKNPMNEVFKQRSKMLEKQIHTSRIMINEAKTDFILTCDCGCGNSLRLTLEPYNIDDEHSFSIQILSDEYYNGQKRTLSNIIKERLKHIWNIIRGKDFLYFDIELDKDSFHDFRNAVDDLDDKEN